LHNTHYYIAFFLNRYTELRIVKPLVVSVLWRRWLLTFLVFFWLFELLRRIWTTGGIAHPLTRNGVLRPGRWENFAEIYHFKVCTEVIEPHPPIAITLELVVKLLLQALMVVPCFVLIAEFASPITGAPRVTNSYKLKAIDLSYLLNTICMIV
jgi:hypothetical protein